MKTTIVDCGVPAELPGYGPLWSYLPERWQRHLERFGTRRPVGGRRAPTPPLDVGLGVLLPPVGLAAQPNLELAAALARAANDWQVAEPLAAEERLRGSILVAHEDAALAVEEVERRAADRRFVQVLLPPRGQAPLGDRRYAPILDAAARHGLPLCLTGEADAHLTSLVFNGTFERVSKLRVLVVDDGVAWVPPLVWRLDGAWKALKDEVPDLKRLPSEYVRERCWFAVGPDAARLAQVVSHLGYDDRFVLAGGSGEGLPAKVLHGNAMALYGDRV